MLNRISDRLSGWWEDLRHHIGSLKRRKGLCLLAGILALSFAEAVIPGGLAISPTNSVGYRLFYHKPRFDPSSLNKDVFVLFDVYTKLQPNCWPCLAVKKIACAEGDLLTIHKRDFYCNGEYIGTAKTDAKDGTPLEAFRFNGVIPEERLFVTGACVDSYDSRYTGFIEKKDIKAVVVPII